MQTAEQLKDSQRLRRYIEREVTASYMNDTKWRELQEAMVNLPDGSPRYRLKELRREEEPSTSNWERDWQHHLSCPFIAIEWLEIDPTEEIRRGHFVPPLRIDRTNIITAVLKQIGISFHTRERFIRIVAHRLRENASGKND